MKTTAEILEEIFLSKPFLEEFLQQELININALARLVQPAVSKERLERVSVSTVAMSIRRLAEKRQSTFSLPDKSPRFHIHVSNDLQVYLFDRSEKVTDFLNGLSRKNQFSFLNITLGISEISLIIDSELALKHKAFLKKSSRFSMSDMSAVTLRFRDATIQEVGVYYRILRELALERINIVELFSAGEELTLVVKREDIDTAFHILTQLSSVGVGGVKKLL